MPILLETPTELISHNIKLICFDVDGTLLTTNGGYSHSLNQQIQRVQQLGIRTAIASGRPTYAAQFLFDELNINDVGVFCTGADIYNPQTQEHLVLHTIEPHTAYAIYRRAKQLGIYCELYTPNYHATELDSDSARDISEIHAAHLRAEPVMVDVEKILQGSIHQELLPIIKLLLGRDQHSSVTAIRALEIEFPELLFAYAHFLARPSWEFASVISPKAHKQRAFSFLLAHYGISAENVMAIGDSHSDMDFIQAAGVGVAMGNANDAVKKIADYVTHTNDNDGVAFALEQLVL